MKVWVDGDPSPVLLTDQHFKGQGGEAIVYVRNSRAYKVYRNKDHALPALKIRELGGISHPRIYRPERLLKDSGGQAIGYEMPEVKDASPFYRIFPRVFREREKLTDLHCLRLFGSLREIFCAVHRGGCLIADPNEMNFLSVAPWEAAYAIDCDGYQTPSFPATALMPSVRDYVTWPDGQRPKFTELSDWYGFGVVTFQLWTGVHPYQGRHPDYHGPQALSLRAQRRVSVFDHAVRLPDAALPVDRIPDALRAWYQAVFAGGRREPPPTGPFNVIVIGAAIPAQVVGLSARKLYSCPASITSLLPGGLATTSTSVVREGAVLGPLLPGSHLISSPHLACLLTVRGRPADVLTVAGKSVSWGSIELDAFSIGYGRLLGRNGSQLLELEWTSGKASVRRLGQCLPNATHLYPGCAIQEMLGSTWVSLLPAAGLHLQVRLKELEGKRIVEAEFQSPVLQVVTSDRRFRFRFDAAFQAYDVEIVDLAATGSRGLNFAVLDTGIMVELDEAGDLVARSSRMGKPGERRIPSAGYYRLYADGSRLLGVRGGDVFHLEMT